MKRENMLLDGKIFLCDFLESFGINPITYNANKFDKEVENELKKINIIVTGSDSIAKKDYIKHSLIIKDIKESVKYKQYRADIIYTKLINRALKMFDKKIMTDFNRKANGYSNSGKPYFLAAFRLSKYNVNDKYQTQWDNAR